MKNHPIKYWPIIGIVAILAVMAFFLFGGEKRAPVDSGETENSFDEGMGFKGIHIFDDNPDKGIKWVLDASEANSSIAGDHILFKSFTLKLEPENRPSIELTGVSGDYDKALSEINLSGGIHVKSNNGYSMITEDLQYKQKEGILMTDKPVKITGPYFSIEGQGLYINLNKEILSITSKVTTLIKSESINL